MTIFELHVHIESSKTNRQHHPCSYDVFVIYSYVTNVGNNSVCIKTTKNKHGTFAN